MTSDCTIKYNLYDVNPLPSSFNELLKVLEGNVNKRIKKVRFQDEEGDMVTITNDLEFAEAIDYSSNTCSLDLTLHVEPTYNTPSISSLSPNFQTQPIKGIEALLIPPENLSSIWSPIPLHNKPHSAQCDACKARIVGIRYKCSNCENYDLCENCEALNPLHSFHNPDHIFLKIYNPINTGYRHILPIMYKQLPSVTSIHSPTPKVTPLLTPITPSPSSVPQSVEDRLTSLENQMKEFKKLVSDKKKPKKNNQIFQIKPKNQKKKDKRKLTQNEPPKIDLPQLLKFEFDPPQIDSPVQPSKVQLLEVETPKVELPKLTEPHHIQLPNVEIPKIEPPKVELPQAEAPKSTPVLTDTVLNLLDLNSQELNKFEIIKEEENVTDAWEFVDEETKEKLNLLYSMGFNDIKLNYELLLQFENVGDVLEELLDY